MLQPLDLVDQAQALRRAFKGSQVRVDAFDAADAGQRVAAGLDHLAFALFGQQVHHDPGLPGTDGEVHGAAHGRDSAGLAGAPVGQVAGGGHLKGTEHANVQVAAAHHRKAVGMVEIGAPLEQGHRLLAGIDQVEVLVTLAGGRAHAEDAVLALQDHLYPFGQVVGDLRRHAYAEVHVGAVMDVARHAGGELVFAAFLVSHVRPPV